jgi:hypothetical protein
MKKTWAQSQLDAGGIIALETKDLGKFDEKATETIVARSYGAPVLGERVVVRLTSERLMPAEDLSMEFLGLQGSETSKPFAKQNRTALEFGHWALIHQPQNAKYALNLVKRMKAAQRKAKSKPGHAWDMYVEMAEELNKSVRHFLPAFWEQTARAYKELGNTTYAGRALSKSLEAERVHSLEVDRTHRRDAILEFTLSGCLTGKALSEYAKDLEKQFPPLEAYETYKDLTIRRTLGGMAPIATAAADLTRLAKAAKQDVDEEIRSVLTAMIPSPAMARAPLQFWKSVKKQVATIVAHNASFAVWLLVHTNPTSSYSSDSPVWEWLNLLEEWKVLPYLSKPQSELPTDVEIPGGRSGWFSRLASVEISPNKRVFDLLEQMTEVLQTENQPLHLGIGYHRCLDVDVLELVLENGLTVATGKQDTPGRSSTKLSFEGWLREQVDHPRRNSQLLHLCEHEYFRKLFVEQFPELVKFRGDRRVQSWGRSLPAQRPFEEAAADHPAIRKVWWEFLDRQLVKLEHGGLADFEVAQENLTSSCHAKTAKEFPDLVERLQRVDVKACLHRTLQAGLLDEYGWDVFDQADEKSPIPKSKRHNDRSSSIVYPYVAWIDQSTLYCVSPSESTTWDQTLTKNQTLLRAFPVGSELACIYYDSDEGWKSYLRWSSAPQTKHEQPGGYWGFSNGWDAIASVGSDGVFAGNRVFRTGDTAVPEAKILWFHDGQRFWRWVPHASQLGTTPSTRPGSVFEIDPVTGKELRASVPPFFEEDLPAGSTIVWTHSHLLLKPPQHGVSPLGESDGLLGLRCIQRRDGSIESQGIDGRSWVFSSESQPSNSTLGAVAILDKPCAKSYWIAASDGRLIDSQTGIGFGYFQSRSNYFAGMPCELPYKFLHSLRLRCPSTSQALRDLTRGDSDKLFDAAETEREAKKQKVDPTNLDPKREESQQAVHAMFPKAPPRLIAGLCSILRVAAGEKAAIQGLIQRLAIVPETPIPTAANNHLADQGFRQLALIKPAYLPIYYSNELVLCDHLNALAKFFRGQDGESLPQLREYWFSLIEDLPMVVWKSFWANAIRLRAETQPNIEMQQVGKQLANAPWIHALSALAQSGILDLKGAFGLFRFNYDQNSNKLTESAREALESARPVTLVEGEQRYVAVNFSPYGIQDVYVLGYTPTGDCRPPKALAIEESKSFTNIWTSDHLNGFIKALNKLDKLPLPSPEKLQAAADRLNLHPISVAILWMGDVRTTPYGQEKLSKEIREMYGWKVKDIQLAITELKAFTYSETLYSACLRESGYLLTNAGHNFETMVNTLSEQRRALVPFPPEISKELEKAFPYRGLPLKEFHELIMDPDQAELLKHRKIQVHLPVHKNTWKILDYTTVPNAPFAIAQSYRYIATAIRLLNYLLPIGHPIRLQIPKAIQAIRTFLDHPETMLPIHEGYLSYSGKPMDIEAIIAKFSTVGKFEKDSNGIYRCETDRYLVATIPPQLYGFSKTAKLKTDKELQLLAGTLHPILTSGEVEGHLINVHFIVGIQSKGMSELIDSNRNTVNDQQENWEQFPSHSVPQLVEQCAKQLSLDHSAAILYLQFLALPDPTTSNIKAWNQWKTNQFQSAASLLLEKELIVQAKRERAGREYFLPGGWEAIKAPNLPLETWKLPLYGYESTDSLRGGTAEKIVPLGSITSLFQQAWKRWLDGDRPAYAEAPIKQSKPKKK